MKLLTTQETKPKGIALILVIFVIALATIVVVNLTYSTYLNSRANIGLEKSLYAEYLLKSCVNIAKIYLLNDDNPNVDGPNDDWALLFNRGESFPLSILGLEDQSGATLSLELIAENRKLPIRDLIDPASGLANTKRRDILTRLFRILGFDDDFNELDTLGLFPNRHFKAEEMVANLIDYMDPDTVSYSTSNFAEGIESALPPRYFPNRKPDNISQLNIIPGFTPRRLRQLEPLITLYDRNVNINFAPPIILRALSDSIGQSEVNNIIEFRKSQDGPFDDPTKISNIIGSQGYSDISGTLDYQSSYFQVIAKVDLGVKSYYLRGVLFKDVSNNTINLNSFEYF